MSTLRVPLFLRGELVEGDWVGFGGRSSAGAFVAPDPRKYVDQLPLASPMALADLQAVPFAEIVDVLAELGRALDFEKNRHVQEAYHAGLAASNYPASILRKSYVTLPYVFRRENVYEIAEARSASPTSRAG